MGVKPKDYYERLGVSRTASDEEIKLAYRGLAREHHPDLHPEKEKQLHTQRMQEVNEAYAVLSSKENRAKYDQLGEHWKEGPPPEERSRSSAGGATGQRGPSEEGFSDFFRDMFRQGQGRGEDNPGFPSELDIEAVLDLSLEDAVGGVEKSFSLMTTGLCQNCRGTGRKGGTFCPVCGGVGEVQRQREVKTKIPPGLVAGNRIRLRGQGNEGPQTRGDLYLKIRFLPNVKYKVDGLNLESEVRVMPWQAALGADVSVPTLDGSVRLRVPKATHNGTRLRLAGKGLGKPAERGDLLIRIIVDIPDALSPRAEALFKSLEEESHV